MNKEENDFKVAPKLSVTKHMVTHLQIEPTTRCNFNCGFCVGRSLPQGDISISIFETILDEFPHVEYIELQGEGEPLLNKSFFDIAFLAKSKQIKLSFITNGSLLNEKMINSILQVPFNHISISIESQDLNKYKEIRRGGDLEKMNKGVRALISERDKRGLKKPAVGFSVTVLKDTKKELLRIAKLYLELKLNGGIQIQPLQTKGVYYNNYTEKMKLQILSDFDKLDLKKSISDRSNHSVYQEILNTKTNEPSYYDDLFIKTKNDIKTCPYLEKSLFINFEGYVAPCPFVKDYEKFNLGKIGINTYDNIVSKRDEMIRMIEKGMVPQPCKECLQIPMSN